MWIVNIVFFRANTHLQAWFYVMRRLIIPLLLIICSCTARNGSEAVTGEGNAYAELFEISKTADGDDMLISISPADGSRDTLIISQPVTKVVCMSSTHVPAFDAVGADSLIRGVSGLRYISTPGLLQLGDKVSEVGYDELPDYEKIISINPDVVLASQTGASVPAYVTKLRSLGVRVFMIYDNFENHPLARAEYIRPLACIAGHLDKADSLFNGICGRYNAIAAKVIDVPVKKVLMNTPYADQWFIPGKDSYMARFIQDAGGEILGSKEGRESSVISVEQALTLSSQADFWLHPGTLRSKDALLREHPLFASFAVTDKPHSLWNNTLRSNDAGGNDFWEGGAMHPDLVLEDLAVILHPELFKEELTYYLELE